MQQKSGAENKEERVAVAIDKDKGSQYALKWAVDHVISRGQSVTLIHVKQKPSGIPTPTGNVVAISDVKDDVARAYKQQVDNQAREVFLPFRCFCGRKDITCEEIILEDTDIPKALIEYVTINLFDIVVLGASSRNGLVSRRFKGPDIPTSITKGAPEFCTVYVISKGKILSVRSATRPVPSSNVAQRNPPQSQIPYHPNSNDISLPYIGITRGDRSAFSSQQKNQDVQIKSPFTRGKAANGRVYGEISTPETDISFVSSGRSSTDRLFPPPYDSMEFVQAPLLSNGSEIDRISSGSSYSDKRSLDLNSVTDYSQSSSCSGLSASSLNVEEVEAEMRRLRLELKQTMDLYNTACKEALTAKQKTKELQVLKMEEDSRLEEARLSEEAALAIAEKEKAKCRAALEAAETAQKIAELEAQKRINAEMKALKEAEEKNKALEALSQNDVRYRKYSIEEIEIASNYFSESLKIGEGGYGPVYKCTLDHTQVAVKVLRPDAAQGQLQFQREVEILSCIRHPNMVLLLGACPEYGCLVYEYMSNGSLEDRLFRRGNTPPLSWQIRFRIAAEIGTGLLFLHQTKPEPLVHRDLKPANILLDRNYVSKISDVGLARLVPPDVSNSVTQYRMTQAAGTFCYIDPEYQQTGMLGIKSDIYSLGILFLQLITAKPPMGLAHHMERAIERGTFAEFLDPSIRDWPLEDTLKFAKISLRCAELRRKDRPDLGMVILPELNRLRDLAEENIAGIGPGNSARTSPKLTEFSMIQEVISDPRSGYDSSKSRSSSSSSASGRT